MTKGLFKRIFKHRTLVLVIALLLILAGLGFWHTERASSPGGPVVTKTTSSPDETPITKATSSYVWPGSPNEPKYLTIPSIGVEGYIQKMGIDQHKAIAAPTNTSFAGWYINSALPGSNGLSVIDGHINGNTSANGIFAKLGKLKTGDMLTIELGNGEVLNYEVMKSQTVSESAALNVLFSQDPKTPKQLNLISCIGDYIAESHTYDNRIIVSARQL